MTVISVISCKNTVAGVENRRLLLQLSQNKMENQVKLCLLVKKNPKMFFRFKNCVVLKSLN